MLLLGFGFWGLHGLGLVLVLGCRTFEFRGLGVHGDGFGSRGLGV